ncbi:MAG TPA: ester cyclase [Candidatus Methylomirabilis sp.]|nr:ester cyclase [Candidatus Methylomirabilis sp.]
MQRVPPAVSLLAFTVALTIVPVVARAQTMTPGACPKTTEAENLALVRAWHEDVINRRKPEALKDILAPEVVHHAAGGYPKTMNAAGVTAMMNDFLTAFPDLRYTVDKFITQDDHVVERYTATGTQRGPLGDLPPSGRTATWTGINIFRIACGRIVEVWSEVDAVSRRSQLTDAPR